LFKPLFDLRDAEFISLQLPDPHVEPLDDPALIDRTSALRDFDDTAALIADLDLVISVDTAVAHLAGALARPVWMMLPRAPDFRWMMDRSDSPWYPTMRLFRQPSPGDWESVVAAVAGALRGRAGC